MKAYFVDYTRKPLDRPVVPVNADGDPLGSSNRAGAFVFGVTPGN
jgi:hypothetical protein